MECFACGQEGHIVHPYLTYFIHAVTMNLSGHGWHINNTFLGCAIYADDLIIISASQCGLQAMLDVCVFTSESFS